MPLIGFSAINTKTDPDNELKSIVSNQEESLSLLNNVVKQACKAGADQADALAVKQKETTLSIRKNKLESCEQADSYGIGLRVFLGQKQAVVSSTDMSQDTITEMITQALAMARNVPEDPYGGIPDHIAQKDTAHVNHQTIIKDLQLSDPYPPDFTALQHYALKAEQAAWSITGITNSEGSEASFCTTNRALVNSHGFTGDYTSTYASVAVSVVAGEGLEMQRDYSYDQARLFQDLKNPETIGYDAGERTIKRIGARKAQSGRYPVIFERRAAKTLLSYLAQAISGTAITRGTSFLKEYWGKKLFDSSITIINNPLLPKGLASKPFDGEGIVGSPLPVIDQGVVAHWLLDSRSARQLNMTNNGNALRSIGAAPYPGHSNFYIEKGTYSVSELLAAIPSGLYITETSGMGVNLVTGDYSQGAAGFWIEKGELSYPVQEVTIAGQLPSMFSAMIAADNRQYNDVISAPDLFVGDMVVAGN